MIPHWIYWAIGLFALMLLFLRGWRNFWDIQHEKDAGIKKDLGNDVNSWINKRVVVVAYSAFKGECGTIIGIVNHLDGRVMVLFDSGLQTSFYIQELQIIDDNPPCLRGKKFKKEN
jgi:hypothetical protein